MTLLTRQQGTGNLRRTHFVDVAGHLAKLSSNGYRPLRTATVEAQ